MGCLISKSKRTKGKDKDYAWKSGYFRLMSSPSKRIKRTENNYADISCINESKRISAGDGCISSNETQSKTGSTADGCLSSDEKQNKKESTADGCLLSDEKQNEEGSTDAGSCPSDDLVSLRINRRKHAPDFSRLPTCQARIRRSFDRNYSKEMKQLAVKTILPHQDQPQVWVPPPPPDPPNPQ